MHKPQVSSSYHPAITEIPATGVFNVAGMSKNPSFNAKSHNVAIVPVHVQCALCAVQNENAIKSQHDPYRNVSVSNISLVDLRVHVLFSHYRYVRITACHDVADGTRFDREQSILEMKRPRWW